MKCVFLIRIIISLRCSSDVYKNCLLVQQLKLRSVYSNWKNINRVVRLLNFFRFSESPRTINTRVEGDRDGKYFGILLLSPIILRFTKKKKKRRRTRDIFRRFVSKTKNVFRGNRFATRWRPGHVDVGTYYTCRYRGVYTARGSTFEYKVRREFSSNFNFATAILPCWRNRIIRIPQRDLRLFLFFFFVLCWKYAPHHTITRRTERPYELTLQ